MTLALNGAQIMEQPLLVHGNDGSAQYHVALPGLAPGIYELKASLRLTAAGIAAQQRLQDERNKFSGQGRGYELEEECSGLSEDNLFSSVVSVIEVLVPEPPAPRQCRQAKKSLLYWYKSTNANGSCFAPPRSNLVEVCNSTVKRGGV